MNTLRIVFYHVNQISRGRRIKSYIALSVSSFLILLCSQTMQLLLDLDSMFYFVASLVLSLIAMFVTYLISFLFVRMVRKQTYEKADLVYGIAHIGRILIVGILLTFIQIPFLLVVTMFQTQLPLSMHIVSAISFIFFLAWNALAAYGIFDGANFMQAIAGSLCIMKEHVGEVFIALVILMVYYMAGNPIISSLTQTILGTSFTAGQVVAGSLVGYYLGSTQMIMMTLVNVLYFALRYLFMMPAYIYLAKLYNDEHFQYMPSGLRFMPQDDTKGEKSA